jgi:hypothetical protein
MFSDIDPTRGIADDSYERSRVFDPGTITMHHMEMIREDLVGKYQASSIFFRNRKLLPTLSEDIERAKDTGKLKYNAIHFGDTVKDLSTEFELIKCEDQFRLSTN